MATASYRTNSYLKSSESEGSDSDDDKAWNRKSINAHHPANINNTKPIEDDLDVSINGKNNLFHPPAEEKKNVTRKVNNIWCTVLQDQSLSDVLGTCNMDRKPDDKQERSCEAYDYTRRIFDTRPEVDFDDEITDKIDDTEENLSLVETFGLETTDTNKTNSTCNKEKKLSPEQYKVAKLIIKRLRERKHQLVFNVVKILGTSKSMNLLKMTEKIEKNGGMMVFNGSRRRTPGGVFFQLIKSDPSVKKRQHEKIFAEDREITKKFLSKKKKKSKPGVTMDVDEKLPSLPTASELFVTVSTQKASNDDDETIKDDGTLEDGEICD